jgi:hypothetical protein
MDKLSLGFALEEFEAFFNKLVVKLNVCPSHRVTSSKRLFRPWCRSHTNLVYAASDSYGFPGE